MAVTDTQGRPLANLRLSVTDRCNIRCHYCMPEREYVWLPREDLLSFEEIDRLVDLFLDLGVEKVRLTGGEPLLRRDLPKLIRRLAAKPRLRDLALTTNGLLLDEQAEALRAAGLHRITVSLDSLDPARFRKLTRFDQHQRVVQGIEAARRAGLPLKIDTVVLRGFNDDELPGLIEFGRRVGGEVRFIEYMDVGGATDWSMDQVASRADMLAILERGLGPIVPLIEDSSAPADRYRLSDGTVFGIIASTTAPFCHSCDRSRLTADGIWYLCLYAARGVDLRRPLRDGASDDQLRELIVPTWKGRHDRGAEERLRLRDRGPYVAQESLRRDPHLEMHTRGG
jgi:cyclic pyranopterin phosphate synthase